MIQNTFVSAVTFMIGFIFGNSSLICSKKNKVVPTWGLVIKVSCLLLTASVVTAGTIYAVNANVNSSISSTSSTHTTTALSTTPATTTTTTVTVSSLIDREGNF